MNHVQINFGGWVVISSFALFWFWLGWQVRGLLQKLADKKRERESHE